jgi:hypothetical protein
MNGLPVWYWVAWALMFLGGEGYALFNRTPGDTLSETVWYWLCGYRWAHPAKAGEWKSGARGDDVAVAPVERKSAWTWRTFAVGAFLLWLFFHLTFGWFAG